MSDGAVVTGTHRRVTAEGLQERRLEVGPPGTLLFAMYASVGAVAELGVAAAWNQALVGLLPRSHLADARFLRYWLLHLRPSLSGLVRSNTQDNLNAEQVGNFPFPLINTANQRAIAGFLDAETFRIDALIARKSNLSQTLYARWVTDLRQTLVPGVSEDLILNIPRGWSVRPLKRLLAAVWAGDWGREPGEAERDLPCVRAADFEFAALRATAGAERSFESPSIKARALAPGDLVIEKSGGGDGVPVGRVVAWRGAGPAMPTNFAAGIRSAPDVDPGFALLAFRAAYEIGLPWRSIKQTTGLQNLDLGHYLAHYWPVPPKRTQVEVSDRLLSQLGRVLDAQVKLRHQISLLQEHRQALITAAVTGELKVPAVAA